MVSLDRVWVPHPEEVWVAGQTKSPNTDPVVFECDGVGKVSVPKAKAAELLPAHDDQLAGIDNICNLGEVSEGAVLQTVKTRYQRQEVYTRVAKILIACNPFKAIPIYGSQYVEKYSCAPDSLHEPPHVFGVGCDVLKGMRETSKNQAVLVSGESGAGKTETTKLILSFMTEAVKRGSQGIQDRILSTNPVLESFGNAMTVRNNNSSRFGKWLEIAMSETLEIKSCHVTDYLLELTRVINQGKEERGYHVFFQMIAGKDHELLKDLGLKAASEYTYTKNCRATAPGIDDKVTFHELIDAFQILGLSADVQKDIFRVCLAILMIGNCDFVDDGDAAKLKDDAPMKRAAELLQMDPAALTKCFLIRKLYIGNDVTETPLKGPQARGAKDAFARLLYGRTFKWLISQINLVLNKDADKAKKHKWFGVLDIAGFESFEINSLEQLFINLGNEKLQAHFNNYVFQNELADYKAEGIEVDVASMNFQDNSDVLALLENKGGVLTLLDEEVFVPKATDQTFVNKVLKAHEKNVRMVVPKMGGKPVFGINHFAGPVMYTCDMFLEKNQDKPPDETMDLLGSSKMKMILQIKELIEADEAEAGAPKAKAGAKSKKTVSINFKASLKALMDKLESAEPHFVRCVKPNKEKEPFKFTPKMTMEQLLFSGVMEAVKIRQAGFASRQPFSEFFGRYRLLLPKKDRAVFAALKTDLERVKKFIEMLPKVVGREVNSGELVLGKAKVFARSSIMKILEEKRPLMFGGAAIEVQRIYRGHKVRKAMAASKKLVEWMKTTKLYKPGGPESGLAHFKSKENLEKELKNFDNMIHDVESAGQRTPAVEAAFKVKNRMQSELETLAKLKDLLNSVNAPQIEAALARATELKLPALGDVQTLKQRAAKLEIQYPLKEAMERAIDKEDLEQLQACMDELKKRGLASSSDAWVSGLNGPDLAARVFDCIERCKSKAKVAGYREEQKKAVQEGVFGTAQVGTEAVDAASKGTGFEMKQQRKTGKKTITGMSEEDQLHCLLQLTNAATEYDVDKMEEMINQGYRNGMGKEELGEFRDLFNQLQTEDFLHAKIKELEEDLKGDDVQETSIKQMRNLAKQLEKISGDELVVADTNKAIMRCMKAQAHLQGRKSIFDIDMSGEDFTEEVETAIEAFALERFPGLKKRFRGHRGSGLFGVSRTGTGSGRGDMSRMVSWSSDELKEALTVLPPALEPQAVQLFRDILGWMCDKPVVECRRLSYSHDIVACAKKSAPLKDEIYCQVMKQLTNNPSERSMLLGWKLLLRLCQEVAPSSELNEFVRCFIVQSVRELRNSTGGEILAVARQCLSDTNKATAESVAVEQGMIDVVVTLIDHSTRKVRIHETSTLIQLGESLATQMRLQKWQDFSFFQLMIGESGGAGGSYEMQRLLPMKTELMTLFEKWDAFKKKTKKDSRLLFKRCFIQKDEELRVRDMAHATLTYRQVMWDYLHYPVCESRELMVQTAAALLFAERDGFRQVLKDGDLSGKGHLEQTIPDHLLKYDKDRKKWSKSIFSKLAELDAEYEKTEPRIQKMSRFLGLCQGMKMFGCQHWYVKQCLPPADKKILDNLPPSSIKVNEKVPFGEYWIMVGKKAVSFVPFDGAPGEEVLRKFEFSHEAMDRIVRWGHSEEILQLVVMTVDKDNPAAGQVEFSLSFRSPHSLDCAFAIQVAKGTHRD